MNGNDGSLDMMAVLTAKDLIRDTLFRYCRAIDRCDIDLLRSVYWPDSIDNHGIFNGSAQEFCDFIVPMMQKVMIRTMHHLTNILIDVQKPAFARAESYFYGLHEISEGEIVKEQVVAGRYLDQITCRGNEWRIAKRQVLIDWTQERPSAADWGPNAMVAPIVRGARYPDDLSYRGEFAL